MAKSVIVMELALDVPPDSLAAELVTRHTDGRGLLKALARRILSPARGIRPGKVRLRVDSSTAGSTQDVLENAHPTITITHANITADETIVLGGTTLTWKASAANENEVTIGANLAADTTNLVAKINAHSALKGIVTATGNTATGVVTLNFLGPTRLARHFLLAETGDAVVISATSFDGDTTDAYASDTVEYGLGIP